MVRDLCSRTIARISTCSKPFSREVGGGSKSVITHQVNVNMVLGNCGGALKLNSIEILIIATEIQALGLPDLNMELGERARALNQQTSAKSVTTVSVIGEQGSVTVSTDASATTTESFVSNSSLPLSSNLSEIPE